MKIQNICNNKPLIMMMIIYLSSKIMVTKKSMHLRYNHRYALITRTSLSTSSSP
uniref:Uncharacterized protein n=1 Tax=Rhizophora mucronata TaxID=61149 RepID=A0A2P2QDX9_RHIMU